MRWLIDTNVWIDAVRGEQFASKIFEEASGSYPHRIQSSVSWVGYSAITRLELLGYSKLTSDDERTFRTLFTQFVEAAVTSAVIDEAIRIRKSVRIETADALIAATAIISKAHLVTRNTSDFRNIHGLEIINPSEFGAQP